jgi:hypothetical protein
MVAVLLPPNRLQRTALRAAGEPKRYARKTMTNNKGLRYIS